MAEISSATEQSPTRVALGLSYLGHRYQGWQTQPSGLAVEDQLKAALAQFTAQPAPTVACMGRTDAGVHACLQVVHFDTPLARRDFSWVQGLNRYLPADVAVQWAQVVPNTFHARFSARTRRYSYVLLESAVRPSLEAQRVGWTFRALNGQAMQDAATRLLGEHDFSSFRAALCQAKSPVRNLLRARVIQRGAYWRFDFEANGFLHHMIRNIMGCLLAVGEGRRPVEWMDAVLAARSRDAAAPTFVPDGLYFCGGTYTEAFTFPTETASMSWLP